MYKLSNSLTQPQSGYELVTPLIFTRRDTRRKLRQVTQALSGIICLTLLHIELQIHSKLHLKPCNKLIHAQTEPTSVC